MQSRNYKKNEHQTISKLIATSCNNILLFVSLSRSNIHVQIIQKQQNIHGRFTLSIFSFNSLFFCFSALIWFDSCFILFFYFAYKMSTQLFTIMLEATDNFFFAFAIFPTLHTSHGSTIFVFIIWLR